MPKRKLFIKEFYLQFEILTGSCGSCYFPLESIPAGDGEIIAKMLCQADSSFPGYTQYIEDLLTC